MSNVKLAVINTNVKGVLAARFEYYPTQRLAEEAFRKGTWTQRRNP